MTTIVILDNLSDRDRAVVINYIISGGLFVLFGYVIYYCKMIKSAIRVSISLLMLTRGFVLLSASGKIMNGYNDTLTSITQWGVIISTVVGFWVVVEFWRWNKRKQCK
jgi:hypothetical protein